MLQIDEIFLLAFEDELIYGIAKQYTVSNNRAFLIKTSHSIYISSFQIDTFVKKSSINRVSR